jgi:hypothetical protein
MQADFPMAPLDHLRELLNVIRELEKLTSQTEGKLPSANAMLLRGEAGIGKTHGILDAAAKRREVGLRSVVLFGEDITGTDPWGAIAAKLGLSNAYGRDSMLDALSAAGEASGFPLVIFVDALNETQPDRRKWQAWLPPMLEQIKRRPFLKLCVSCRDTYLREVVPDTLTLPTIVHNGFLGREYEALFAYFQHFSLGMPAEPLLQEEFANPLFLRLVCEALQASGARAVPAGRAGLRSIIDLLLQAKNEKAAVACDYDRRENRVVSAMLRLAGAMAAAERNQLPLQEAKALVDGAPGAHSKSLFGFLEGESLISTIEQPAISLGETAVYSVRFTFERVGDHLIIEHLLSKCENIQQAFVSGGPLHFLAIDEAAALANAGLLEALSIQLPEIHQIELIDSLQTAERNLIWGPFIAGLQWRSPIHISRRTREIVREALSTNDTSQSTLEAVLILAARPEHPLNASFLHQLLSPFSMLERDPFWANMLETSYSDWSDQVTARSSVHRLIDTACRGNLAELPDDVGTLWAITLAWFCASPDRRIRDRATMAMVCIFRARPTTVVTLIRRFAKCEDEYISERVLVAAYGALLLNQKEPHVRDAATEVYQCYFVRNGPPLNVSIRDHARLIIELAVELGVPPPEIESVRHSPPYSSPWPITLPKDEDLKQFVEDHERFPRMNLTQQFNLATGTDFARYIIEPRVIDEFDIGAAGLDKMGLFRWFFKRAVELGYPGPGNECALFDRILLREFGGGRGKPGWAERLGKKYYWIFLRQLVGQISDHVSRKSWSGALTPPSADLQGLDLRDIDPTDLRLFAPNPHMDDLWVTLSPYEFTAPDTPDEDVAWVAKDDLPDIKSTLILTDSNGIRWHALDLSANWRGKRSERKVSTYRYVTRNIAAFTCNLSDVDRVGTAFSNRSLNLSDNSPDDYRGYLGEYPARLPYKQRIDGPPSFTCRGAGIEFDYVELRQLRGSEWQRDYSQPGESPTLLMPSPKFVGFAGLHWDGLGSWVDHEGVVQMMDPRWWGGEGPALICRLDYLDRVLVASRRALIILAFQAKFIAGSTRGSGRVLEHTLFVRRGGETQFIQRKVERD